MWIITPGFPQQSSSVPIPQASPAQADPKALCSPIGSSLHPSCLQHHPNNPRGHSHHCHCLPAPWKELPISLGSMWAFAFAESSAQIMQRFIHTWALLRTGHAPQETSTSSPGKGLKTKQQVFSQHTGQSSHQRHSHSSSPSPLLSSPFQPGFFVLFFFFSTYSLFRICSLTHSSWPDSHFFSSSKRLFCSTFPWDNLKCSFFSEMCSSKQSLKTQIRAQLKFLRNSRQIVFHWNSISPSQCVKRSSCFAGTRKLEITRPKIYFSLYMKSWHFKSFFLNQYKRLKVQDC